MLDHNTLSLIKPKRLYEDKSCIIKDGIISMELGATSIVAPYISKLPTVEIKVKDLWTLNLDAANTTTVLPCKIPKFISWLSIPISVQDVTVFSSISSVGEDTFFLGEIAFNQSGNLWVNAIGLTWMAQYSSQKVIEPASKGFSCSFDWYIFYYLFQMFKDLSGKKTSTLLWQEDRDKIYFTNVNHDYYIICDKTNHVIRFKDKFRNTIQATFEYLGSPKHTSFMKKQIQEDAKSEVKHLLRPLGDIVNVDTYDSYTKFSEDSYKLFVTKEK